jgi:peptidyl-prolyl cis-trans isomerase D
MFSDDSLKNKRNTEAIEVAPNTLLAARVNRAQASEHQAVRRGQGDIEAALKAQEAAALARAGRVRTSSVRCSRVAEDKIAWGPVGSVSRQDRQLPAGGAEGDLPSADVQKLPAYVGAEVAAATTCSTRSSRSASRKRGR